MRRAAAAFLIGFGAALAPAALAVAAAGSAEALVQEAAARGLAADPYWRALLAYPRRGGSLFGPPASEVLSPDFFLAATGRTDPAAELAATLRAFFLRPGEAPDEHAQCRFVARFQWLGRKLDW